MLSLKKKSPQTSSGPCRAGLSKLLFKCVHPSIRAVPRAFPPAFPSLFLLRGSPFPVANWLDTHYFMLQS